MSENFAFDLAATTQNASFKCPVCTKEGCRILAPVKPLRQLYYQLKHFKKDEEPPVRRRKSSSKKSGRPSLTINVEDREDTPLGLLSAFHEVVRDLKQPIITPSPSAAISENEPPPSANEVVVDNDKELMYAKNFPFFRKQYQHGVHHSKFFLKHSFKLYSNTALSPCCTRFALLAEKKWQVFETAPDFPERPPSLMCCGKADGSLGSDFDNLTSVPLDQVLARSNWDSLQSSKAKECLSNWEQLHCKMTKNLLVIAGTRGVLRIYNLANGGSLMYTYFSKFAIRCIDLSENESFVALGIMGKDRLTNVEQALVVLLQLDFENGLKVDPITITLPYGDPINVIQFSSDSRYVCCSTALESRFIVISIVNPAEPRLVMKSIRSLDTSLESEGITDLQFFPDNRIMTLTSVAFNSTPIVIDTKVGSIVGVQGIAQPVMLARIEEVGSTIHKAAVSPRGDAVAFLDRNGLVYLMSSSRIDDFENRRVVVVAEVSNAYRVREAAAMRFSGDGYKLFIVDRKGILYVQDFTAGWPQDHEVTRCKLLG